MFLACRPYRPITQFTRFLTMPPKRKTTAEPNGSHVPKKSKPDLHQPHPNAKQTEAFGIVLRQFYPPEMSNERCQAYIDGELERPIETLQKCLPGDRRQAPVNSTWQRSCPLVQERSATS